MKAHVKKQQGVALIEVLIAFFVLAIGLLGLAGLQIKTLQFNQSAYQRSQATIAAYDMMDRMRSNRDAARVGNYNLDFGSAGTGSGLVLDDVSGWLAFLNGNLPDGQGRIECDDNSVCVVAVRWTNRFDVAEAPAEGEEATGAYEQLEVTSQL